MGRARGDGVRRRHAAQPVQRRRAGCAPPLPPARSIRPPGRDTTHSQNPSDDAATVDAPPACATIRSARLRRAAGAARRRDRHPSVSARAGPGAGSRARLAIAAGRRGRPRQDDSGRPRARGAAPARLVRARAHRHAGGTSAAVGRGAAASIRDSRSRPGRGIARGARPRRCRST